MDGRASKSCNGFQDLQKEVRAIKGIKNTGSSRNFAAVTVQHIKGPSQTSWGQNSCCSVCNSLFTSLEEGAPPATSCRGAIKEAWHSTASSRREGGKDEGC